MVVARQIRVSWLDIAGQGKVEINGDHTLPTERGPMFVHREASRSRYQLFGKIARELLSSIRWSVRSHALS